MVARGPSEASRAVRGAKENDSGGFGPRALSRHMKPDQPSTTYQLSKRTILAAPVALLCAEACAAERAAVEDVFASHVVAIQSRDLVRLETTITRTDNLVLILPDGRMTQTREEYLAFHRSFFASLSWSIEFARQSTIVAAGAAVITTLSDYRDVEQGAPVRGRSWLTFMFVLEEGVWRLVHDQNTRALLPPESSPQ